MLCQEEDQEDTEVQEDQDQEVQEGVRVRVVQEAVVVQEDQWEVLECRRHRHTDMEVQEDRWEARECRHRRRIDREDTIEDRMEVDALVVLPM